MSRKTYASPNSYYKAIGRWREQMRERAVGAVVMAGGVMDGFALADKLGISPRALRRLLVENDGPLSVSYEGLTGRGLATYRVREA